MRKLTAKYISLVVTGFLALVIFFGSSSEIKALQGVSPSDELLSTRCRNGGDYLNYTGTETWFLPVGKAIRFVFESNNPTNYNMVRNAVSWSPILPNTSFNYMSFDKWMEEYNSWDPVHNIIIGGMYNLPPVIGTCDPGVCTTERSRFSVINIFDSYIVPPDVVRATTTFVHVSDGRECTIRLTWRSPFRRSN